MLTYWNKVERYEKIKEFLQDWDNAFLTIGKENFIKPGN